MFISVIAGNVIIDWFRNYWDVVIIYDYDIKDLEGNESFKLLKELSDEKQIDSKQGKE